MMALDFIEINSEADYLTATVKGDGKGKSSQVLKWKRQFRRGLDWIEHPKEITSEDYAKLEDIAKKNIDAPNG